MADVDASLAHLFSRVSVVESSVRATVAARRAADPAPDDPFKGLYVSDEHVDRLLEPCTPAVLAGVHEAIEAIEADADAAVAGGAMLRLRLLQEDFDLTADDLNLLLVSLAPDLDSRFEKLYGYLNDDVTKRRATIGLAFDLSGLAPFDAAARARLTPGSPLIDGGLVVIEDTDRPYLTRLLRVPDRVCSHLLGSDTPDMGLAEILVSPASLPAPDAPVVGGIAKAIEQGATLVHVRDRPGAAARATAASALSQAGFGAVVLDLVRLRPEDDVSAMAKIAAREARLTGAGLVVGPIDVLDNRGKDSVRALAEAGGEGIGCPVVLIGRGAWDPSWSREVPVLSEAATMERDERHTMWRTAFEGDVEFDPAEATSHFRLAPEQVERARLAAERQAWLNGSASISVRDMRAGARAQNAAGLEGLARRVDPKVGFKDLVLPPLTMSHLHELANRAKMRDMVLGEWKLRPGGGRGWGIAALFAGDSGTGKTMASEVLAYELGLDMYSINLATVVDKYVGETEKNLDKIFSEADGVNGILLFDEADALFGKRSEVKDAHDRYANIEVAYLLQRMESFDGIAILSTNLRANIDDAFARRLDAIIDFPMPDQNHRKILWNISLGPNIPRAMDMDLDFMANNFELSGGNIRSIALSAAYLAAETGKPVTMADMIRATGREYRKLGRLVVKSEFKDYFDLVKVTP